MPKAKQLKIPATIDPMIEEIDEAAEAYTAVRDARIAAGKQETEAMDVLLGVMHRHKRHVYSNGRVQVEVIAGKTKVKVRRPKEEE